MRWYGAGAATALAACLAGAAFATGVLTAVTTSGTSMRPAVSAGDLVVVRSADSYAVGDIAAYRSRLLDTVVLHRIVAVEDDRYVLQGDDNAWLDPENPTQQELLGTQLLRVPQGGTWLRRLTSPPALAALTFLLLTGGATATTTTRRRRRRRKEPVVDLKPGGPVTPKHRPAARRSGAVPPAWQPYVAGACVVGLAGAAVTALAWTRPLTVLAPASTSGSATMALSYEATVPPSAAYDGTTVSAPSPVFRALTDSVEVTYRYDGGPGRIAAVAELSTANGWRTTLPLTRATRTDGEHRATVRLDLAELDRRAAAAAAVIGLPVTALTVSVVPTVELDGGGRFAPSFALTLDEHALRPPAELTAKQASTAVGVRPEPAVLSALGGSVEVAKARMLGPVTAALALLAALSLVLLGRAAASIDETERARREHGELLLRVLPVALPPGRAVIDVPDVRALCRLAERYGLLVLFWSRSGTDTYVVQDENTTYRYRSDQAGLAAVQLDGEPAELVGTSRSWHGWPSAASRAA